MVQRQDSGRHAAIRARMVDAMQPAMWIKNAARQTMLAVRRELSPFGATRARMVDATLIAIPIRSARPYVNVTIFGRHRRRHVTIRRTMIHRLATHRAAIRRVVIHHRETIHRPNDVLKRPLVPNHQDRNATSRRGNFYDDSAKVELRRQELEMSGSIERRGIARGWSSMSARTSPMRCAPIFW